VNDVAREYSVSEATIYNWKAKYGGMDVTKLQRFKDLEAQKLRQFYMLGLEFLKTLILLVSFFVKIMYI
jgi:putative transposase